VDELQPRDVVSRAITHKMLEEDADHMLLDATGLERFDERFPTIAADLRSAGSIPPGTTSPSRRRHYHCGGILTDLDGASSLPGLWAAGEVACTGVHGANRLASNSLLEGMVFGPRVIEAIGRGVDGPSATGAMRAVVIRSAGGDVIGGRAVDVPDVPAVPVVDSADGAEGTAAELRDRLQRAMTRALVCCATPARSRARSWRRRWARRRATEGSRAGGAAQPGHRGWALLPRRRGARAAGGCHTRDDFPDRDPCAPARLVLR
jgi:L-aspartate oxidase